MFPKFSCDFHRFISHSRILASFHENYAQKEARNTMLTKEKFVVDLCFTNLITKK